MPEGFRKTVLGPEQQLEMSGAGAAGVGHVDMGIGAVGDQRVGVLDHLWRDVGVQVEADHQWQVLADHLAHAGKDFAFAVVKMLGDHRAMQVEIDGVDRTRRGDAVDHHLCDALEGILGDMRARGRGRKDRRHQVPAFGLGRRDETRKPHIDAAQRFQHTAAHLHARPAAAMHKGVIGGLGRRKCVGLVQEAANGDAGHSTLVRSSCGPAGPDHFVRDVRPPVTPSASDEAIPELHAAWAHRQALLTTSFRGSRSENLRCAVAHRGISRFPRAQLRP